MDTEFETDFELRDKRQKGIKNRRSKEFKNFAKSGLVEKRVIHQKNEGGHWVSSKKVHSALNEVDPFNLDFNIEYSLNKKNRWGNVAEMQRVEQLEDLADNVKVTTVEKVFLRSQAHWGNKPLATAYHEVDESGNHVVRRAKHYTANEQTLTEKPRLPKKQRDEVAQQADVEEVEPTHTAHVRYEVTVAHPSEKYWRQQYWKIQDRNRCVGKVSNSRAKKAALNGAPLNGYDDDYSYESETDSFDEDIANASDHGSPQNEYSLFDFVNNSSKKPKKSERFEFVDANSVVSLSSDEDSEGDGPSGFVPRAKEVPSASKDLFASFAVTLRPSTASKSGDNQIVDLLPEIQDPNNVHKETELTEMKLSAVYQSIPSLPKRYVFDLSEQITYEKGDNEKFIVILERKTVNKIGITLNGNFVLDESVSNIRKAVISRSPKNVESLLYSIVLYFRLLKRQNLFNITPKEHTYLAVHKERYQAVPSCFSAQTETIRVTDLMSEAVRQLIDSPYYEFASEQLLSAPTGKECGICFSSIQLDGTALEKCAHTFCNECWQKHCGQRLRSGLVPIPCPDASCNAPIPLSMLMSLMPIKHFVVYKKMLLERYLLGQKITHCPCCNQAISIIESSGFATLSCSRCNITWCQLCQMPVHWPLNCDKAALYNDRFDKQKRFSLWQSTGEKETRIQVKLCPKCRTPMEKGDGCDHMSCRCGASFCWRCLFDLSPIGVIHSCTTPSPTTTIELRDVKKLCLNNKMAKVFFEKCHEFRTRRIYSRTDSKLRDCIRRTGATVDERSRIASVRIEALYLMEFAFAWLYVCGRGKLFGGISSLCDRLEFACGQVEGCGLDGQKEDCLKKAADCQALSQQLIDSLRDARLIIMQYEKDE